MTLTLFLIESLNIDLKNKNPGNFLFAVAEFSNECMDTAVNLKLRFLPFMVTCEANFVWLLCVSFASGANRVYLLDTLTCK